MQARAEAGEASLAEMLARLQATDADLGRVRAERDRMSQTLEGANRRIGVLLGDADTLRRALADTEAAMAARVAELDAALSAEELARQLALAELAATEERLSARIAELDAALSDEALARQLALADLADTQDRLTRQAEALDAAEVARLAEAAAAEALRARLAQTEGTLTEAERQRLADLAAAEALRARLAEADTELTAMTLALEAERRRAEETLTLLAAANLARAQAESAMDQQLTQAQTNALLLALANEQLAEAEAQTLAEQRQVALLNEQVSALRRDVAGLQDLLGEIRAREADSRTQIEALGSELNAALARAAFEERRRAELETERARMLEEEARQLERYRSEFFGRMRDILAGFAGVRIVGDRFVFSSEVLFELGSADLAPEGQAQIADVVAILSEASRQIPPEIDWILRVDGHTDDAAIRPGGRFASNWELSQARALAVVLYMIEDLGFPPDRLAATGFGEYRPVVPGSTPEARAQNRRIELKLTER